MYPLTNCVQYAQSQPNVNLQSACNGIPYNTSLPTNLSLSQRTMPQPTYPSQAALYASQPQNDIPIPTPAQLQPAEQHWKIVSRKRGRKRKSRKIYL